MNTLVNKLVGNWLVSNDYARIAKILKVVSQSRPDIKTVVIDDLNYLLSNEIMSSAEEKGWIHALTNLIAGSLKEF